MIKITSIPLCAALALAGCSGNDDPGPGSLQSSTFDGVADTEMVHYTGTEPFWGGAAGGGMATYTTPENPDGAEFPVERFAGNNGLGISGTMDGVGFDLTITPGECSDAMSDRSYPFTATLLIGNEQRQGCAWTDSQPFTELEIP
ncbi:COG3650 family protein [Erythrobacter aureus]|uniref:COG3650 family protein n=1 Tax=Erythrobacter aureus TaxID=2182384 RepID=UPI003A935F24